MNQKLLLALIFSLFSSLLFSQNDYIKYYQLINKVKQDQNNKQNDSLTIFLKQAFELVDYVHIDNLKFGKRIAKKHKDDIFLNYCENQLSKSKNNIDLILKSKLDSVGEEDQRVRGRKYFKAKDYYSKCIYDTTFICNEKKRLKSKKLMEEWWRIDSCNIKFIKDVISKFGYPSEKLVGKQTNSIVSVIVLHYDKDTSNHIMGEHLYIALQEGLISPKMYAWIIDRHLMAAGKNQLYYSIPFPWENISKEQKLRYNQNRYSIGLKSLDELKIIVRGNSVYVKS